MIRQATPADFVRLQADTEAALRILSWRQAYGESPFVAYWAGEEGTWIARMGDTAVVRPGKDRQEAALFLSMQPEIRRVRTDAVFAQALACRWRRQADTGAVMEAPAGITPRPCRRPVESPPPREVYDLLQACFGAAIPAFADWYADVHHRWRRGLYRLAAVREGEAVAAAAMTVAECAGAALIGAVATLPEYRSRGYASACVSHLASCIQSEGKTVFLSPKNAAAQQIYARLGFAECGRWGAVAR